MVVCSAFETNIRYFVPKEETMDLKNGEDVEQWLVKMKKIIFCFGKSAWIVSML